IEKHAIGHGSTPARGEAILRGLPQFGVPLLAIQMRRERTPTAQQPTNSEPQPPPPAKRLLRVVVHLRAVSFELLRCGRFGVFAKRSRPHVQRESPRAVAAENPSWVRLQERIKRFWRESPVVAGVCVNVEVERAAHKKHAIGSKHASNFLEAFP